jgi:putative addiction module component (TIGR02574 family)
MTVEQAVERILAIDDADERALIVERIEDSVRPGDREQSEIDAAWRDLFRERIDNIQAGRSQFVDVDESHARIRATLAERRRKRNVP